MCIRDSARRDRNTTNPTITIVVPVLNEARNLELILPELPPVHQVVLVDGHSVDDTVATARRLMPDITAVSYTHLDVYKRQGILRAGPTS